MTQYIVEYRFDETCTWQEHYHGGDGHQAKLEFVDHVRSYPHTQCRMRRIESTSVELAVYTMHEDF